MKVEREYNRNAKGCGKYLEGVKGERMFEGTQQIKPMEGLANFN